MIAIPKWCLLQSGFPFDGKMIQELLSTFRIMQTDVQCHVVTRPSQFRMLVLFYRVVQDTAPWCETPNDLLPGRSNSFFVFIGTPAEVQFTTSDLQLISVFLYLQVRASPRTLRSGFPWSPIQYRHRHVFRCAPPADLPLSILIQAK